MSGSAPSATLAISSELIAEIVAHARDDAPHECCGMVGGRDGMATSVHRARNAFESPVRFEIHAGDQLRITEAIEDGGEEVVAMYHSHPRSEAEPSPTDINLASLWPGQGPLWIICSLLDDADPVVRAFAIGEHRVEEVELAVD